MRETSGQTAAGTGPVLELSGVTVGSLREADRVVLSEVHWTVQPGDYWAVGGLQSSGKSDLLATAVGLMRPLHGHQRLFGQDLAAGSEHQRLALRLRLGLVFEGGGLLYHLSVGDNVALPLRYHRHLSGTAVAERVQALLHLVGLAHHAAALPGWIVRTWQQRVGLARALALSPEVLVLDNPLAGLDRRQAAWWLDLLDRLAEGHPLLEERPLTLIVASDDLQPWRTRARQFAILENERFLPLDSARQPGRPSQGLVRELMGSDAAPPASATSSS